MDPDRPSEARMSSGQLEVPLGCAWLWRSVMPLSHTAASRFAVSGVCRGTNGPPAHLRPRENRRASAPPLESREGLATSAGRARWRTVWIPQRASGPSGRDRRIRRALNLLGARVGVLSAARSARERAQRRRASPCSALEPVSQQISVVAWRRCCPNSSLARRSLRFKLVAAASRLPIGRRSRPYPGLYSSLDEFRLAESC